MNWTLLRGALAGWLATVPMTLAMLVMQRNLPRPEREPLPPETVTRRVLDAIGLAHLDLENQPGVTLAAHFAYGATAGTVYALVDRLPGSAVLKGIIYGVSVWVGSYLGWLPAFRLHPSARQESDGRNRLMIVAHLIWGGVTGLLYTRSGELLAEHRGADFEA